MADAARTVGELADQIRSKNAGPFWVTLDVFLSTDEAYNTLVGSEAITPARMGQLYLIDSSEVEVFFLPHLRVVKVSFPRSVPAGSFDDRDQHAGQQHVPLSLMTLEPQPSPTSDDQR